MQLTEQFIMMQAPNGSAAENGRKLSRKGSFSGHSRTEDHTLYWAQCAGSGKKPYQTSLNFSAGEQAPVCRCSCPSRQFPCKHGLGLMFELLEGKPFAVTDIPEDLAEKRAKQMARAEKKAAEKQAPAKPRRTNTAARRKKLQQQLDGLEQAQRMVCDLLTSGLATLAGASAQSYEKLARDLGSYYLTGPQTSFSRIALAVKRIQAHPKEADACYAEALRELIALHATIRKSRELLARKLESGETAAEDTILYEALGGIWKLEELEAIGSCRDNARLIQLSFDVTWDEARKEYIERGFWVDAVKGDLVQTLNYRPAKALNYVKATDSCFEMVEVPRLYEYPGEICPRVRWEQFTTRPLSAAEQAQMPALAKASLSEVVKQAKNQFKNTLSPKWMPALLPVGQLGEVDGLPVLEDPAGHRLLLRNRPAADTVDILKQAPVSDWTGSALFGLLFYDESDRSICLHPYSVITAEQIIRLQF